MRAPQNGSESTFHGWRLIQKQNSVVSQPMVVGVPCFGLSHRVFLHNRSGSKQPKQANLSKTTESDSIVGIESLKPYPGDVVVFVTLPRERQPRLTSGKRNDFEDLGIVQFRGAWPLRPDDRSDCSWVRVATFQLLFHATQDDFLNGASLTRRFSFKFTVHGIRNVDRSSHIINSAMDGYILRTTKSGCTKTKAQCWCIGLPISRGGYPRAYLLPPLGAGGSAGGAGVAEFVMVIGRFSSKVSSVPAGRMAERCLPSQ
jgi:hypothetical protein